MATGRKRSWQELLLQHAAPGAHAGAAITLLQVPRAFSLTQAEALEGLAAARAQLLEDYGLGTLT